MSFQLLFSSSKPTVSICFEDRSICSVTFSGFALEQIEREKKIIHLLVEHKKGKNRREVKKKKRCHSWVWARTYHQQVSPNETEVKRMIIPASEAAWVVLSSRILAIRHAEVCFRCQEPAPEMTLWPCKGIMKVMMRWKVTFAQKWSVQGFSCCQTWQLLR